DGHRVRPEGLVRERHGLLEVHERPRLVQACRQDVADRQVARGRPAAGGALERLADPQRLSVAGPGRGTLRYPDRQRLTGPEQVDRETAARHQVVWSRTGIGDPDLAVEERAARDVRLHGEGHHEGTVIRGGLGKLRTEPLGPFRWWVREEPER